MSHFKNALKTIPGLVILVRLCKFLASPDYRYIQRIKYNKPKNLFQPYNTTKFDRYPGIFAFISKKLQDVPNPRILSFGCSTGEEVFSLRQYFPGIEIVGIDINPRNIAVCRKKLAHYEDSLIHFKLSGSSENEPESFYDAIFCMSVFRHGDLGASNAASCDHLIRFDEFEKMVADLCRCLMPGGYLIIRNSNFRFEDTIAAAKFDVMLRIKENFRADTPLYGPDNKRLPDIPYNDVIFYKRMAFSK